jgi:hypothetical protein
MPRRLHRSADNLQSALAKNGSTQAPQAFGVQFQTDQKQHQQHAELGTVGDVLHVGEKSKSPGSDGDARCEVSNDGAQAQSLAQRHGDHGGAECGFVAELTGAAAARG